MRVIDETQLLFCLMLLVAERKSKRLRDVLFVATDERE
jgi:hypothetical protein